MSGATSVKTGRSSHMLQVSAVIKGVVLHWRVLTSRTCQCWVSKYLSSKIHDSCFRFKG
jgi:hypothetical protein